MTKEIVNSEDWTGRGGVTIHIPSARIITDKIREDGPVRWHFLTTLVMFALMFATVTFIAFPGLFKVVAGLAFACGIYAAIHGAIYVLFFHKTKRPGGGYYDF